MKIFEIIAIALSSIRANKLRTSLTLIGITVGIFSIIVIMTVITMLQNSIENGVSMLAKNTFQIQKFPPMMDHHDERFRNRKDLVIEDYERLKELLTQAKYIGAEKWTFGKVIKFMNKETNPNIQIAGMTPDAIKTNNYSMASGRDLRDNDIEYTSPVVLLGKDVADKLFPNMDPVGHEVRADGNLYKVIGVLESQGSTFGQSQDNLVIIPLSTYMQKYGKYKGSINITVMTHGKLDYNETIEAATGFMRAIRKVPAGKENDFDIYSNESLLAQINDMTKYVKIGAMIISLIALLAAGVGIMNIMLVSVTERTREIGIRKAVGAKKISILSQFLVEAITLCLIGGLVGILLGVGLGNVAGMALSAEPTIPMVWVAIGLGLCVLVGVLFGTYPAYKASNLDPIEALRYE